MAKPGYDFQAPWVLQWRVEQWHYLTLRCVSIVTKNGHDNHIPNSSSVSSPGSCWSRASMIYNKRRCAKEWLSHDKHKVTHIRTSSVSGKERMLNHIVFRRLQTIAPMSFKLRFLNRLSGVQSWPSHWQTDPIGPSVQASTRVDQTQIYRSRSRWWVDRTLGSDWVRTWTGPLFLYYK